MSENARYSVAQLSEILDAARNAAIAGEAIIRAGAARLDSLEWQTKGPADYLTEIDTSSEIAIRDSLQRALAPSLGLVPVLGEESWDRGTDIPRGLCFVVDPLDGTTNFLHGVPAYAVSIAALYDGEPVVGVVRHAAIDETYTAMRGAGAWLNGEPMRVSSAQEPARSLIATGIPFGADDSIAEYTAQMIPVARATAGIRRAGAAALDLAGVAAGRYEAFWELQLSPWDIAAGILMIEEAGGVVTGIGGERATLATSPLVAGSPHMHAWMLRILHAATPRAGEAHR